MSRPGGSGNLGSTSLLTTRQWLQQRLPYHVTDFGPTPGQRQELVSGAYVSYWDRVPREVDDFVVQFEDSTHTRVPFHDFLFTFSDESEAAASRAFAIAISGVCSILGLPWTLQSDVSNSTPRLDVGAGERAVILAASPVQKADFAVSMNGRYGETLFLSDGIPSTSPRFLGVLAYILQKGIDEPGDFETPVPKAILPTTAPGSLKSQGSEGDNKGKEKGESGNRQMGGMRTRSQGPVCDDLIDTPAELLHLARHHFATGWSGKIVRGTYEGQSIVVKLAPIGSNRAKALLTEVAAYHMLKEFWGKYVPKLVSYGTTVGGTIVYIATEEIKGYEFGLGPVFQEVVEEIFHALAAVHERGILHGDIRDSNILVVKGQQASVRLLDFGFARFDTSDEDRLREYAQLESLVSVVPLRGC